MTTNLGGPNNFAAHIGRDLQRLPAATREAARPRLRAAGELIKRTAGANASWSSRIPGALDVSTSVRADRSSVRVTINSGRAPHARLFEGLSTRGSTFRHPVFGNRRVWVAQRDRPFLFPAVQSSRPAVDQLIRGALAQAAASAQSGGSP